MLAKNRPFFKWAGGKYRILEQILPRLPAGKRLVEPFAGSGAIFLNADYESYLLCDLNPDLIFFYQVLLSEKEHFIERCGEYFLAGHNTQHDYYRLRDEFNSLPQGAERAAIFLYLNRHCFNGLVRYNLSGLYNVPYGRHKTPYFPRKEMQNLLNRSRQASFEFAVLDFRQTFARLRPGDVVYCDPPYLALSATAKFTSYTAGEFAKAEQLELARLAAESAKHGNPVLISNHNTPEARQLYRRASLHSFSVQRFISRDGNNRQRAPELLALFE